MSNEPNIRNRVAGAVVLVSLAVIFLPLILDGQKKNQILDSYIPEKPKTGEIILINVDDSLHDADKAEASASQPDAVTDTQETVTIAIDEITEPAVEEATANTAPEIKPPEAERPRDNRPNYSQSGFLVQMGSFSSQTNAQALVQKMRAANHPAYYKTGQSAGKRIYRVFSGPYLKKSQAQTAMTELKSIASVNPIVVTYDPLKHAQNP